MSTPPADCDTFPRIDRYRVRRKLGEGGMGVVYEAFDDERQITVALKTLRRTTARGIFLLKKEFRALAEVVHPNLVSLFDLLCIDDQWFFTMEYIEGRGFLDYSARERPDTSQDITAAIAADQFQISGPSLRTTSDGEDQIPSPCLPTEASPLSRSTPVTSPPADYDRVRHSLRQLVEGLSALHSHGYVHQDIKPSNVLVEDGGRVVLLDFGVIAELYPRDPMDRRQREAAISGTPRYMAPELLRRKVGPSEATDWYSVGIMLYEALTGWRPYQTAEEFITAAKERIPLPHPSDVEPIVPRDLADLCMDLVSIDWKKRPNGPQVMQRLGMEQERRSRITASLPSPASSARDTEALFVGRKGHLETLRAAFETVCLDEPAIVRIHGRSGIGKSTLVWRFLDNLIDKQEALVFSGRCYEHESVPFKAVDSLVDSIVRYLQELPSEEIKRMLPDDVAVLTQLFPVMRGVEAAAKVSRWTVEIADPLEKRRRGFAAFRTLIHRLSTRAPVVLFIDDLQWGDIDSAPLLSGLMRPPEAPKVLFLAAYRSDEAERSALLHELLQSGSLLSTDAGATDLVVGPLSLESAKALALAVMQESEVGVKALDIEAMAQEMMGDPYLIRELVPYAAATEGAAVAPTRLTLDDLLHERISRLPRPAQHLLELVAVSGMPVSEQILRKASGQTGKHEKALRQLRAARLVVASKKDGQPQLESQHDRISEIVLAHLSDSLFRQHHLTLLEEHEAIARPDMEYLLHHSVGAADVDRIHRYAARAAEQAIAALAFDRAARHYRRALEFWPVTVDDTDRDVERRSIWVSLGDALSNAGRGVEAAEAFQQAAVGASTAEALKLNQRAAEQLLVSGHVDRGIDLTRQVLSTLGMKLPRTPLGSLFSLLFRRLQIRLRGVKFKERDQDQVPDEVLVRGDIFRSIGIGLAVADHIKGADFSTRYVLSALETGEPNRVIIALLMEANYLAASARSGSRYHHKLITTADALLSTRENHMAMAYREGAQAYGAFMAGAWTKAKHHAEQGIAYVQKERGGWWELAIMRQVIMWSLFFLGELKEMSSRVFPLVQEAQERGDLFAVSGMVLGLSNLAYLNQQGPENARMRIAEILQRWSVESYLLQHWYAMVATLHIDLYQGEGLAAYDRLSTQWPQIKRSLLLMIPSVHYETLHMRGRASLAAAQMVPPSQRSRFLSAASKDARRLARHKRPLTAALAGLLRAGVAAQRGKTDAAITQLKESIHTLDATDTLLYAAAARRRLGTLMGGEIGAEHLAQCNAFMEAQGVKDPARMTDMLVPGFGD